MPRNAVAFEVKGQSDPRSREAGAYWFMRRYDFDTKEHKEIVGIGHACPCGCGSQSAIWFRGGSMNGEGSVPEHEWDVTGEWPKASLTPSIGIGRGQGASADRTTGTSGGFHWHGFLRAGVFEEC